MSKNLFEQLVASINQALPEPIENIAPLISKPKESKMGDFALPCFVIAKNVKKSPAECAAELAAKIVLPEGFEKAEATGPWLNFFLNRTQNIKTVLTEIIKKKGNYAKNESLAEKTILLDYSAPNIAKPFHIGHLRTTIIGFSLYRIFKHLGYNTIGINHLGDWGTQFGYVYAGCKFWGKPKTDNVAELVKLYTSANILRKQQENNTVPDDHKNLPDVFETAKTYFLKLEDGEPEAINFWKYCLEISLKYLKQEYERLGIDFDYYTGESFYISMFPEMKRKLEEAGILEESNSAWGVDLGEKLGFARLLTEDGRSLYLTRDIITVDYREKTFSPEKILYIVGAPQTLHFQQLKALMQKLNHPATEKIVHIAYGHVPGIGTRNMQGDTDFSLSGLIKEAEERALKAYEESVTRQSEKTNKNEIAHSVALAAIYFNYLSRTNIKDFHFNWDEALNFQGDAGPYLLYALARLNSIIRKANAAGIICEQDFNSEKINSHECYEIVSLLENFPTILQKITQDYELNHLAQFLLNLAKNISKNYKNLRVLGETDQKAAKARLVLFTACKYVLETGISLLGIPPLERM